MNTTSLQIAELTKPARKRRAPGAGKTLERLIAAEQKLPNPPVTLTFVRQEARWIPDRATGRVKLVAFRGPVDAFGTYRGRAIVFDMKECAVKSAFNAKEDHVHQHQVDQLVRHGRAGAIAGLLILATATGLIYWLDWTDLEVRRPTYRWDHDLAVIGSLAKGVVWESVATFATSCFAPRAAQEAGGGK